MNAPDRQFARAIPTEQPDPVFAEAWEAMSREPITDAEVESWIAEFAESGYVEHECGNKKNMSSTLYYAVAQEWVHDKSALPSGVSSKFWQWSKSNASIANY